VIRRSFRFGLRAGVLIGLVLAAWKLWQARSAAEAPGDGWSGNDRGWSPPPPAPVPKADRPAGASDVAPPDPIAPSAPSSDPVAPPPAAVAPPSAAPSEPAPSPDPAPPEASATKKAAGPSSRSDDSDLPQVWVEPVGTTCPPDHPIKVKLASRLFHIPGMFAYERTRPDRCYAEEQDAVVEGFSRAKR
jgi:hypothetical protein